MRRLHSFWMRSHMQRAYRDKYELTTFSAYLSLSFVNFYMHFILFVWYVHAKCSCMRYDAVAVDIISYTRDTTAKCLDMSKDISRTYYVWKATLTNQLSIQQTCTHTHTTLSALTFFIIHIVSFGRTVIACGRKVVFFVEKIVVVVVGVIIAVRLLCVDFLNVLLNWKSKVFVIDDVCKSGSFCRGQEYQFEIHLMEYLIAVIALNEVNTAMI